jgi:hypothetical protein
LNLAVEIRERAELTPQQKIPLDIAYIVLDLAFGLRPIGTAKSRNKAVVVEEIFELSVPGRVR